ncbi:MAG TPA: bacillithiol biosynthesis BshC [Thermoanaerobaculia bacterium]|nr:bacillithiol biosynthesis BshC [Thermoanaerobaculia bacterium]
MRVPLAHYPGMNRFVLDWLGGDERFLRRATPNPPRRVSLSPELATAIDQSNRHWGIFASDALRRWASGETLTIVAGQQVGFAGGPLYTLAKIATLVRFKRDMEKQGIPVTPFFWLATEDHDFDEAATLCVPVKNAQRDLLCMRAVRTTPNRAIVGTQPIPETLITQLLSLAHLPRPTWLREGITFRDSFAELIASIFGSEVILVDALLPELRRAGAPLFDQIRTRESEIQAALRERSAALKSAGYNEQVTPNEAGEYTLLYSLDDHDHRQPITGDTPAERISTSALTRPLLQDSVLQPDIFVGGPAEVAYYAQLAPLHQLLGVRTPRVALRAHALVAPRRVLRAFERYEIDPAQVFASADAILTEREPEGVARIREIAEQGKRELLARVTEIGELALPADHSLAGSIQKSIGHLEWHFNKLSERAIKGLVRKDKERLAATRDLVATLYPDGNVQDRIASWFAMWCEHGQHLVDRLVDELEPDSAFFRIVEL